MEFTRERYVVLEAIARGAEDVEEVAEETSLPVQVVRQVVSELKAAGLVDEVEKKGIVVKHRVLAVTPKGMEVLAEWRKRAAEEINQIVGKRGYSTDTVIELGPYIYALPILAEMGLLAINLAALNQILSEVYGDVLGGGEEEEWGEEGEELEEF